MGCRMYVGYPLYPGPGTRVPWYWLGTWLVQNTKRCNFRIGRNPWLLRQYPGTTDVPAVNPVPYPGTNSFDITDTCVYPVPAGQDHVHFALFAVLIVRTCKTALSSQNQLCKDTNGIAMYTDFSTKLW
eukprot:2414017-Rhodomonas_salina.1